MAILLATGRWCIKEDPAVREKRKQLRETQERPEGPASSREERCASDKTRVQGHRMQSFQVMLSTGQFWFVHVTAERDVPLCDVQTSSEP